MCDSPLLIDGPQDAAITLVLAHGAGAPMDSNILVSSARALDGGKVNPNGLWPQDKREDDGGY